MHVSGAAALIAVVTLCGACGGSPTAPNGAVRIDFDFNRGPQGWTAGQAQYPLSYGWRDPVADYRALPAELDGSRRALYLITGGEDIFTFYKGRAAGLQPQTFYRITFQVEIATNTALDVVGAGGPPGEGTFVKAGASAQEPIAIPVGSHYWMNIDKGLGSLGGVNALTLGNIGIPRSSCHLETADLICPWQFKQFTSGTSSLRAQADANGSLWFLVGTDQSFFSGLELYYTRFTATLTQE